MESYLEGLTDSLTSWKSLINSRSSKRILVKSLGINYIVAFVLWLALLRGRNRFGYQWQVWMFGIQIPLYFYNSYIMSTKLRELTISKAKESSILLFVEFLYSAGINIIQYLLTLIISYIIRQSLHWTVALVIEMISFSWIGALMIFEPFLYLKQHKNILQRIHAIEKRPFYTLGFCTWHTVLYYIVPADCALMIWQFFSFLLIIHILRESKFHRINEKQEFKIFFVARRVLVIIFNFFWPQDEKSESSFPLYFNPFPSQPLHLYVDHWFCPPGYETIMISFTKELEILRSKYLVVRMNNPWKIHFHYIRPRKPGISIKLDKQSIKDYPQLINEVLLLISKTQTMANSICENCGEAGKYQEIFHQIFCEKCVQLALEKKKYLKK